MFIRAARPGFTLVAKTFSGDARFSNAGVDVDSTTGVVVEGATAGVDSSGVAESTILPEAPFCGLAGLLGTAEATVSAASCANRLASSFTLTGRLISSRTGDTRRGGAIEMGS